MMPLPIKSPWRLNDLIDVRVTHHISHVVAQISVRVCNQFVVVGQSRVVEELSSELSGTDVVQVVRPEPAGTRFVLLPRWLENRPEIKARVHQKSDELFRNDC